jgi:hypothetical protein
MARLIVGGVYKRNLELLLVQMTEPRRKLHGQKFNTIIRFNRRLPKLSDNWAEDSDSAGGTGEGEQVEIQYTSIL